MSLFEDTYLTLGERSEGIFRDKGSKFIAYAYPFRNEKELKEIIVELKALHPKARHHCWAYRLTTDRSVFRVNDDGEPSGTAGRPILNVLLSKDLTNVLVVVVRYFGGTLLGVPGLINAYKNATLEALAVAQIEEKTVNDIYAIGFDYLQMNDVMRVLKEEGVNILNQQFDNNCVITIEIRKTQVNQVLSKLDKIEKINLKYLHTL
ncbi:YigZ family protein [Sphingobacterium yanglingense]|uniref:Putative YigZ family protein n=1 Tax=Sphingobacterium yanglingense TaxID=1437280 RepID=A0A4R6WI23_9SPHI|nr:YigZ family protein [Sphingobacterium yanglingense]TDQ79900.1 putative YigZ family protein [Sphingobacterium yanglingense]